MGSPKSDRDLRIKADMSVMVDLRVLRIDCTLTQWVGEQNVCQWCMSSLDGLSRRTAWCSSKCSRAWERNHVWRIARSAARRRDKYSCIKCGEHKTVKPIEVNHIVPLVGKGYGVSCSHHLSNLEALCVDCHRIETNAQFQERKNGSIASEIGEGSL